MCSRAAASIEWRAARIGPFTSAGGFDYHFAFHHDVFGLLNLTGSIHLNIAGLLSMAVDGMFSLIGFPPVHVHHSQVSAKSPTSGGGSWGQIVPPGWAEKMLLINHQDSNCYMYAGYPGELCNIVLFPTGYSQLVSTHIGVFVALNDVRPEASAPMNFWYELGFQTVSSPRSHSVRQWRVNAQPGPFTGLRYAPPGTFVYRIPDEPSIIWSSTKLPFSGKLLNFWLHSHTGYGLREAWYIDGTASDLGFTSYKSNIRSGFLLPHCSSHNHAYTALGTVEEIKQSIRGRMQRHSLPFRCIARAPAESLYDHSMGDRQMPLTCEKGAEDLVAGEVFSCVFFVIPPANVHLPLFHTHYQGYVGIDSEEEYSSSFELASSDSVEARLPSTSCSWEPPADIYDRTVSMFDVNGYEPLHSPSLMMHGFVSCAISPVAVSAVILFLAVKGSVFPPRPVF